MPFRLSKKAKKAMIKNWGIGVGDLVEVTKGAEGVVGKRGVISSLVKPKNRVVVEGVNMGKKHMKPNPLHPRGGIISVERSIHHDDVKLVDPFLNVPTDFSIIDQKIKGRNEKVRLLEASGKILAFPKTKKIEDYEKSVLDTDIELVHKVTWKPDLMQLPFPPSFLNQYERFRRINKGGSFI